MSPGSCSGPRRRGSWRRARSQGCAIGPTRNSHFGAKWSDHQPLKSLSSREQQPWRGRRARHWLACNGAGIYFGFRSIRPCPWLGQQDSERQLSWDWTPDSLTRSTSKFVNVQHELDGETSINLHPGPWARWPHEKASPQRCAAITVTVTRRSGSLLLSLSRRAIPRGRRSAGTFREHPHAVEMAFCR